MDNDELLRRIQDLLAAYAAPTMRFTKPLKPPAPAPVRTSKQRVVKSRHKARRWMRANIPRECRRCGYTGGCTVHHRDGDPLNNAPENLEWLCRRCHDIEHHMRAA